MKSSRLSTCVRAAAVVGSLIALFSTNVSAQITTGAPGLSALVPTGPFIVRFDEDGHATIAANGGCHHPDRHARAGPHGARWSGSQLALTFMLPSRLLPATFPSPRSPALRRVTGSASRTTRKSQGATGAGPRMLFYSDVELGETNASLADRGFPTNLGSGNTLAQLEVGLEGNNGFDYRPGAAYPNNNEYVGISDAVPEPETYALMLAGLGALGLVARRRKQR
jgi:hypothetical protein